MLACCKIHMLCLILKVLVKYYTIIISNHIQDIIINKNILLKYHHIFLVVWKYHHFLEEARAN